MQNTEDFSRMDLYPPIGLTVVAKPPCPQCVMGIHDYKDTHDDMFDSFLNSVLLPKEKTRSNHGKRKHNRTKRAKK